MSLSCAVLCAIPASRRAFFEAASASDPSDYMQTMLTAAGVVRSARKAWEGPNGYSRIAEALKRFLDHAGNLGATIKTDAALPDLTEASASHSTVIVIGHWKGAFFSRHDFNGDLSLLRTRLLQTDSPVGAALEAAIYDTERTPSPSRLLQKLNGIIANEEFRRKLLAENAQRIADGSPVLKTAMCRDMIDGVLSPLVRPGNRLELADGLHAPGEVAAALAAGFDGDVDLTACHSTVLAQAIKLIIPDGPTILSNESELLPTARLILIDEALRAWAAYGGRYAQHRLGLEAQLVSSDQFDEVMIERMVQSGSFRKRVLREDRGMALKAVIERHAPPVGTLGGGEPSPIGDGLEKDLRSFRFRQALLFWLILLAVAAVFGVLIWGFWRALVNVEMMLPILAGLGGAVIASVDLLRRVSRDWGRSSIILLLLNGADQSERGAIVQRLLTQLD